MAQRNGNRAQGAVFTRGWVVELILDLGGYVPQADLGVRMAVEPACGAGAFLLPMVDRLLLSSKSFGRHPRELADTIRAHDIDTDAVRASRELVRALLRDHGVRADHAENLVRSWIQVRDFLIEAPELASVDFVLGNPPYVRLEDVDPERMARYRHRWPTMTGRADVYVGFLEAGLRGLRPDGVLAVICADRWMRNQYGAALRRLVGSEFSMEVSLVMHEVDAFEHSVSAYPAVVVIRRRRQQAVLVGEAKGSFGPKAAAEFRDVAARGPASVLVRRDFQASWSPGWFEGPDGWPATSPERQALLARLEKELPALEETGVRVGVGVATGADSIFVVRDKNIVEKSRRLRTVAARETKTGSIEWKARWLVNPWDTEGLVDLDQYPLMKAYLSKYERQLKGRHTALKQPTTWWRTIDRIDPNLATQPKLLVPDLKDRIHPVLDVGTYYPLHSLYYLVSDTWDLAALGGILLSDVANAFVEAYSVRMANGYLRVSAQYLRRIRLPDPASLQANVIRNLGEAFHERDLEAVNRWACEAYRIGEG